MKKQIKNAILQRILPAMKRSNDPLDRLLGFAAGIYDGSIQQSQLAGALADFYQSADLESIQLRLDYEKLKPRLIDSGYKLDILDYTGHGPWYWSASGLWVRRLRLFRQLGIRLDLLVLDKDQTIPPHAHRGVLSGFMVLEGKVAIRHFHVEEYLEDSLCIRQSVDRDLGVGDYTVNSELQDNIHWLQGLETRSVLFRFNASGIPSSLPDYSSMAGRLYINPQGVGSRDPAVVGLVGKAEVENLRFR